MKKVKMILTNRFDPDVRVYKEAKYLISKGFEVEILCWDRENEYKSREVEVLEGINIRRFFPYAKYGTGFKQLIAFYQFLLECKKYLKNKEYHFLHCHDLDGILVGYLVRKNKSKLIFDMHEIYEVQGVKQKIRYLVRMIVNYMQNKSDYIIYVTEFQINVVSDKNKNKLIHLPNYPDKENYGNCEKSISDKLRISYIGAIRQYDELKNLMDACKGMNDVKISIHGTGVAYKRLNDISTNYRNVSITGRYDFVESASLYNEADILYALYPTSSIQYIKSYPIKLFEAIITKTPIIVSKNTVLERFVLENDIGFIVDGNDVKEVKRLIKFINENRHILNEKAKNLEKIQYNYNWEEVVQNLCKIYTIEN